MIKDRLKRRIFGEKKKIDLRRLHHKLMKSYGFIPLEEFKRMHIPTVMGLLSLIIEDEEEYYAAFKKLRKKK